MNFTPEDINFIHETYFLLQELKECNKLKESLPKQLNGVFGANVDVQIHTERKRIMDLLRPNAKVLLFKYPFLCDQDVIDNYVLRNVHINEGFQRIDYDRNRIGAYEFYRVRLGGSYRFMSVKTRMQLGELCRDGNASKNISQVYDGLDYFLAILNELLQLFARDFFDVNDFIAKVESQSSEKS